MQSKKNDAKELIYKVETDFKKKALWLLKGKDGEEG